MSEDLILWMSIGGLLALVVLIIVLANYLTTRANERRGKRMMKDIAEGRYDKNKKYFGEQGDWETDEFTDATNAPPK